MANTKPNRRTLFGSWRLLFKIFNKFHLLSNKAAKFSRPFRVRSFNANLHQSQRQDYIPS